MSRDIRSFFSVGAKSNKTVAPAPAPATLNSQKRKTGVLDSDSDDDSTRKTAKYKLNVTKKDTSKSKKRRIIDSSDEEENLKNAKKQTLSSKVANLSVNPIVEKKIKAVNVNSLFGDEPIKRKERSRAPKIATEKKIFENSTADIELLCIDESVLSPTQIKKEIKASPKNKSKHNGSNDVKITSPKKDVKIKEETKSPKKDVKIKEETKSPKKEHHRSDSQNNFKVEKTSPIKRERKERSPSSPVSEKRARINSKNDKQSETIKTNADHHQIKANRTPASNKKQSKKSTDEDLDLSVYDPDQERHEKKRATAMLYQKFQKRPGPANPGSKEIPKGKPNCLVGLTFVLTGVLDSMEKDEAAQVIKDFGGRVTTAVSGKTTHLVAGEESGPAKLAKAEELKITILSEDDLLDLIREKSGEKRKTVKSTSPQIKKEEKTITKENGKRETKNSSPIKKEKVTAVVKKEVIEVKFNAEAPVKNEISLAWVDKYKPKTIKEIIGQQGAASNCEKLVKWLTNWQKNNSGKVKPQRPNPWAKNDDGAFYKAALLSGPPGVGKTTTAQLACKHLGFDTIEFNASDTRSKKLLKVEVAELLSNKTLHGYFNGSNKSLTEKQVLIMDEVDGMAGNEDRGGMQELISLIKTTSVPIICMCNDRNHPKIRSLVNYCFDLRYARPRMEQIKGAILSICCKEKIKISPKTIEEVILATNNDIRQSLNSISLLSAKPNITESTLRNDNGKKDLKLGPWEVVRKVFSAEDHKSMTLNDKSDLFFHDYSLGPLFVQQNYLSVAPNVPKAQVIEQIALTADSLSLGDLVENRIRSRMAWSMLPVQAMYSSVLPGEYMKGHFTAQVNFPGWLGKYSKTTKRSRLAQEIHDHTRVRTSGSRLSVRLDYAPFLLKNILQPMIDDKMDGVEEALSVIKEYRLLREDIDSLVELTTWPGKKSLMDSVDGKVKAALTRAYNKEVGPYTYSADAAVKKKKSAGGTDGDNDHMNEYGEDGEAQTVSSDEEDNDNLDNDVLIKAKKSTRSTSTAASKGSKAVKAGTSGTKSRGSSTGKKTIVSKKK